MLLEMNKNKAKRLVEIASTLVLQKTHKLNFTGEEGITYVSSAWLNSIDPHYSTSGRFDPFYEVIDDNYVEPKAEKIVEPAAVTPKPRAKRTIKVVKDE